MALTLAILSSLAAAYLLLRPHFAVEVAGKGELDEERVALLEKKERLLQVLKDLEHDHQTQKISDADYQSARISTGKELADVLKLIDSEN
jgi:hypothetical protein